MKTHYQILFITILFSSQISFSQNIFKQHGIDNEPLTLTGDKYSEFFNSDEIVQIGTVLLNTTTNKIVAFVEDDSVKPNYNAELSSRWFAIDPLAEKYFKLSPYSYVANNPIKYIDIEGRKIGDPNSADAQRLGTVLNKTETGAALWNSMVNSERTIYIHFASTDGSELNSNIRSHLTNKGAQGETVSSVMYEKISKGEEVTDADKAASWSKNEETGEYTKTDAWDETHLILDDVAIQIDAEVLGTVLEDDQKGKDLSDIRTGGEEAAHSVQESADMENDYENAKHEVDAKETVKKMEDEYLNQ